MISRHQGIYVHPIVDGVSEVLHIACEVLPLVVNWDFVRVVSDLVGWQCCVVVLLYNVIRLGPILL